MLNINFLRSFGFLIFPLILLFSSASQADIRDELKTSKSCGTYENTGIVKLFSWEICEQDFTYRMFYKLMPTIMDEYAIPLTKARNLKEISNLESERYESYKINEYSLINITKSIIGVSLSFGMFIFLWNAFLAFVRTSTDGKFLGDGYSWQRNMIKYGIILIMLLPLGNGLIVINLLVIVLILFAIAFGNAIFSVYLNFYDVSEEVVSIGSEYDDISSLFKETPESREQLNRIITSDHNYYAASKYIESLYRMQICKRNTESYILESSLNNLQLLKGENEDKYGQLLQCIHRPDNPTLQTVHRSSVTTDGFGYINNSGFLNATTGIINVRKGDDRVGLINGINFGLYNNLTEGSCSEFENIQHYTCGQISVSPVNAADDRSAELLQKTGFIEEYSKATQAMEDLSDSLSVTGIEAKIASIWQPYERKIIKELGTQTDDGIELSSHAETVIKTISYLFHQQLINDVYTGRLVRTRKELISPSKGDGQFYKRNKKLYGLAERLIGAKCYSDISLSNSASSFIKQIEDGFTTESDSEKSAYCVSYGDGKIASYFPERVINESTGLDAIEKHLSFTRFYINDKLKEEILKVYTDLTAIERSFYKSLRGLKTSSLTSEMRKLGFATSGSLGLKLVKNNEIDTKLLSSIRSSVGFNYEMSNKFIGKTGIADSLNIESPTQKVLIPNLETDFENSMLGIKSQRLDMRQVNLRSVTQNIISQTQAGSLASEDPITTLLSMAENPLASFKKALGYETATNLNAETMTACMKNLKKCPIPAENPIIAITDFGNDLVSTASNLMATTVVLVFTDFAIKKGGAISRKYKKAGSVSDKANSALGAAIAGDGLIGWGAKQAVSMLSVAATILKILFPLFVAMLMMGMFFAYIIPLIPFLMFQFSYIAWITMALTVYFISPIWLVMNLKLEQDANTSNNMYRSGYNMAMQVLFRPAVLVLAMSIGWGLFNGAFLTLNFTIAPFLLGVTEASAGTLIIGQFFNTIMIIVIYGLLSFILIRYVFKLTYTLVNKLFDAMNVENVDDQRGNITDDVMRSALISSIVSGSGMKSVSEMINKVSKNASEADASHRGNSAEEKIDDLFSQADLNSSRSSGSSSGYSGSSNFDPSNESVKFDGNTKSSTSDGEAKSSTSKNESNRESEFNVENNTTFQNNNNSEVTQEDSDDNDSGNNAKDLESSKNNNGNKEK